MTDNQRGSLYMTLAMAAFAVEDMFLKAAAQSMPLGLVLLLMGLSGMIWYSVVSMSKDEPPYPASLLSRTMVLRSLAEVLGRVFYGLAIALTPLSVASSILQATPLVVVLGAALLFGETVTLRRWGLIVLGFVGVLIIIRPGAEGFDVMSLLAVAGLLGFAGRDLATRAAPLTLSNAQLGNSGFSMLALAGLILLVVSGTFPAMPDITSLTKMAGAAGFAILAYSFLTSAMRTGEVSAVTPFRYSRLLFAMVLGIAVFGERPDAATLIGAAVIVVCGILILTRRV